MRYFIKYGESVFEITISSSDVMRMRFRKNKGIVMNFEIQPVSLENEIHAFYPYKMRPDNMPLAEFDMLKRLWLSHYLGFRSAYLLAEELQ